MVPLRSKCQRIRGPSSLSATQTQPPAPTSSTTFRLRLPVQPRLNPAHCPWFPQDCWVRLLGSDGVGRSEPKQPSVASIESRWERSNNVPRIFLSPRMLMHILPDFFDFAFTVEMLVRIPAEADHDSCLILNVTCRPLHRESSSLCKVPPRSSSPRTRYRPNVTF
jgi:hypothetical protein